MPVMTPAKTTPAKPEGRKSRTAKKAADNLAREAGLRIARFFTQAGRDPFDDVEWELRTAAITGEGGKVYFEQKDVEIPKAWSQTATNVVVQKYFRGLLGTPERERSVKQMVARVADTIYGWGKEDGYFA